MSAAISTSMMTVCLTRRSHSQMPTMHSTVKELRKIVSMTRESLTEERSTDGTQRIERPACLGTDPQIIVLSSHQTLATCVRNHGRIVGTEFGAWITHRNATLRTELAQLGTQLHVGAHTTGNNQRRQPGVLQRAAAF